MFERPRLAAPYLKPAGHSSQFSRKRQNMRGNKRRFTTIASGSNRSDWPEKRMPPNAAEDAAIRCCDHSKVDG